MPIYQNGQRVGALFNSGTEQTTAYMNGQLVYSKDDGLPVRPAGTTTNLSVGYIIRPSAIEESIIASNAVLWSEAAGFTLVSSTLDRSGYTAITSENDFALSVFSAGVGANNLTYVYPWSDAGYGAVRPETFEYPIICKSPLDNTFVYRDGGLYGTVKWSLADGFHGVTPPQNITLVAPLTVSPTANTVSGVGQFFTPGPAPLSVYPFDSETGVGSSPIPLPTPPAGKSLPLHLAYHPSGQVAFIFWVGESSTVDGDIVAYQVQADGGFGATLDSYTYVGDVKTDSTHTLFVSPTGGAVIVNGRLSNNALVAWAIRWNGSSFGAVYPPPPASPPSRSLQGLIGFDAQGSAIFYALHREGVNSKILGAIRWSDTGGFGALHTPLNIGAPETPLIYDIWPAINYIENTND